MKKSVFLLLLPALLLSGCGGDTPPEHVHTYSEEWSYNETKHWHDATCGHNVTSEDADHIFKETVVAPTSEEMGYTLHECTVCDYSYKDNYDAIDETSVDYEIPASLRKADSTKTGGYNVTFDFKEKFFDASAKVFNKDLALLSDGMSLMAATEDSMRSFYSTLMFDDIESHYVKETTPDSLSYAFAHRIMKDYDLIAVVINGHDYGLEWENNALLGESGDHEGFSLRANEVYQELQKYTSCSSNYKLWISGFSRGGAISNLLAHYLISRDDFNVDQEDMFVYTFECPKGLAKENAQPYENVFNVLYSADLVTYIAPAEFGFARCGIDVDLYTTPEDLNAKLLAFDEDIEMPEFKPYDTFDEKGEEIKSEQEGLQSIITYMLREDEENPDGFFVHTRQDYVEKMQHAIGTVFTIIFSLPDDILSRMKDEAMTKMFEFLNSAEVIYNFLIPYLDEAGFQYKPEVLHADCEAIYNFAMTNLAVILRVALDTDTLNGILRGVYTHFPEVGYILLRSYEVGD